MIKYSSLNLNDRGIHTILNKMVRTVREHQKKEDLENSPESRYYQWYMDIVEIVENYFPECNCIIEKVLERLAVYGKVN